MVHPHYMFWEWEVWGEERSVDIDINFMVKIN